MDVKDIAFIVIAIAMVGAALRVVTTRNVVHAALYLVVVLAGSAAQYILLAAEFVAWVQIMIYIGAVIILFLFGIMLTKAPMEGHNLDNDQRIPAAIVSLLLGGVLIALIVDAFDSKVKIRPGAPTSTELIGNSIFRSYVVPFEVVSILLLAALIGAVVLAKRD